MRISEALINKYGQEDEEEEDFSHLPSVSILNQLMPQLVKAAQETYNCWNQSDEEFGDPDVGFGGICQDIASAFCSVLSSANIDCMEQSAQIGEQHVWAIAKFQEGVYEIDIHPSYYETGGGYNWKKIPDVQFDESIISINRVSPNPNDFEKMSDY